MKLRLLSFFLLSICFTSVKAQIKIGDNPQNIDAASVLELESTSRVLVITRVTTAQMNAIVPLQGGLVYNTETLCFHYYDGTEWINLCGSNEEQTFTTDAIENDIETIIITENGGNFNFEVNQITGNNIVDGTINGFLDIQPGSITSLQLQDDAVGLDEIQDNAVGSLEIIDESIMPIDIGLGGSNQVLRTNDTGTAVEWETLDFSNILGQDLIAGDGSIAVNSGGIGATLINTDISVAPDGITNDKIADNAINTENILDGQVQTNDIENDAITTTKILDANVTDAKLDKTAISLTGFAVPTADLSIGTFKLTDVVDPTNPQDVATMNYVDTQVSALNTLADGTIYLGDAANTAQEIAINGDATMDNTGNLTIENDAITTTKILDANVTDAKLDKTAISLTGFAVPTADLSIGTFKLTDVVDPTNPQDVATMNYVDTQVSALNTLADGTIYLGDAANTAQEVVISGDATIDNTGLLTIENDAITTTKILDANVTDAKLDKTNIPLSGFGDAASDVSLGTINKLINVADPTNPQDAATMNYVDTQLSAVNTLTDGTIYLGNAANTAQEVVISGDATIDNTGFLTIESDAVTTTKILDANVTDAKLDKTAISLTGFAVPTANLSIGAFKLTDVNEPTNPQDAATMNYVDTQVSAVNTLTDGTIYLGNAANTAQEVVISGDATIDNTGFLTIESDAVTPAKIEPSVNNGDVLTTILGGVVWQAPAVVAMGKVSANASTNNLMETTVVYNSTGNYTITFNTALGSADYIIQLTLLNAGTGATIEVTGQATTSFTIQISDNTPTAIDASWYFTVLDF